MSFSLNEVEATAKKATRGAGFSWGLAEEAGRATRWLCAQGLDGCGELAALLREPRCMAPQLAPGIWSASGVLCPLITGAALADFAALLRDGPIRIVEIAHPTLLLPFACAAARQLGAVLTINFDGHIARTDGSGVDLKRISHPPGTSDVIVALGDGNVSAMTRVTRADPDPTDWATLTTFAGRTYAPATEASRRLGAGSGLSDND